MTGMLLSSRPGEITTIIREGIIITSPNPITGMGSSLPMAKSSRRMAAERVDRNSRNMRAVRLLRLGVGISRTTMELQDIGSFIGFSGFATLPAAGWVFFGVVGGGN